MKKLVTAACMAAVMAAAGYANGAPVGSAVVTIYHGVPGLDGVIVNANGGDLPAFNYLDQIGPVTLPSGMLTVKLRQGSGPTLLEATVVLENGKNYTAMAHLAEGGSAKLSFFENNIQPIKWRKSRLTMRHTADAPAVDAQIENALNVKATRSSLFAKALGLANVPLGDPGQFGPIDRLPGRVFADIYPAGAASSVDGTPVVDLTRETSTIVYVVGSLTGGLSYLVQQIPLSRF
jgi:hypothetical protein